MSTADQLRLARISGIASRHTAAAALTEEQRAQALADLRQVADGRVDILAEHAGTVLGASENGHPFIVQQAELIAELCLQAGADADAIERWRKVGRQRSADARRIPYTGARQ